MSNSNSSSSTGGIGVIGLLGVVFVTLKLTGYIDWSWWWVTLPFWGFAALFLIIAFICIILWLVSKEMKRRANRKYGRFGVRS